MTSPQAPAFCTNHGTPLTPESPFCTECGQAAPWVAEAAEPEPTQPTTVLPSSPRPARAPRPPRPPDPTWPVVSIARRATAALIDLELAAVCGVAALLAAMAVHRHVASYSNLRLGVTAGVITVCAAAVAAIVTTTVTPSLGQRAMRLTIIEHRTGEPASFGRGVARGALSAILHAAFGFAAWSVLWHPRRRGWADRLTGSTVVSGDHGEVLGPVPALAAVVTAALGGLVVALA
jgi:uncharacterized RDD family membrane protein YckC